MTRKVIILLASLLLIAILVLPNVEAKPSWWNSAAYADYSIELRIGSELIGEGSYEWSLLSSTEQYGVFKMDAKIRIISAQIENFTLPLTREINVNWVEGDMFIFQPPEKLAECPIQYIVIENGAGKQTYKTVLFQSNHNKTWYDYDTGILVKGIIIYDQIQVFITLESTNTAKPLTESPIPSEYLAAILIVAGAALLAMAYFLRKRL